MYNFSLLPLGRTDPPGAERRPTAPALTINMAIENIAEMAESLIGGFGVNRCNKRKGTKPIKYKWKQKLRIIMPREFSPIVS